VLGYTREEMKPELYWATLHPDDRSRILAEDQLTNRTGEPYRVQYRQRAKDGRWVWIRDEALLVHDERGNPLYWQGVRFDITRAGLVAGSPSIPVSQVRRSARWSARVFPDHLRETRTRRPA